MTVGQRPHAARDFSALFGTGSIQAILMVAAADTSPPEVSRHPVLRSHPWPPPDHPPTSPSSSPHLPLTMQDHTACPVDPDVLAELRAAEHDSPPGEPTLTHHPHPPDDRRHGPDSPPTPATDVCHDVDAPTSSMEIISGWEADSPDLVREVQAAHRLAEALRESVEDDAARADAADRTLAARGASEDDRRPRRQTPRDRGPRERSPLQRRGGRLRQTCVRRAGGQAQHSHQSRNARRIAGDADLSSTRTQAPVAAFADTIAASIRDAAAAAYSSSELDANCEMAIQASLHLSDAAAPSSSSLQTPLRHLSDAYDSDDDPFS